MGNKEIRFDIPPEAKNTLSTEDIMIFQLIADFIESNREYIEENNYKVKLSLDTKKIYFINERNTMEKIFDFELKNNKFRISEIEFIDAIDTVFKKKPEFEEIQQYRLAIPTIDSYRLSIDNIGVLENIDPELEEMLNNGENIVTFDNRIDENTLKSINFDLAFIYFLLNVYSETLEKENTDKIQMYLTTLCNKLHVAKGNTADRKTLRKTYIIRKLNELSSLYGFIDNSFKALIQVSEYNPYTDIVTICSPYLYYIANELKKKKTNNTTKYIPVYNKEISADIIGTVKNSKIASQLAGRLTNGLLKRGKTDKTATRSKSKKTKSKTYIEYHISITNLIAGTFLENKLNDYDINPDIKKPAMYKNQLLKDNFTNMFDILVNHTPDLKFDELYVYTDKENIVDLKEPTFKENIKKVIPTSTKIDTMVLVFKYKYKE